MLASVAGQSVLPAQVIIVDGSAQPIEFVLKNFPTLNLTYVRVFPPGLAKQRNAGMANIQDDITVAGYLDDDLVLEPNATEKILEFWNSVSAEVGGAAFSIINQPLASSNRLSKWFLIGDELPGKLLTSGFQSQIPFVQETVQTDWLYGGATLWRREVIRKYSYDEWYIGTGYLEDVDYSYRVRQEYQLFVVGDARVYHYSRPIPLERNFVLGRHQVVNRTYFVRKMNLFSRPAFAWAIFGQLIHNLMSTARRRNSAGLRRVFGNLVGLYEVLTGELKQIPGHYK